MNEKAIDLLKRTVCAGLSESDLQLFIHVCDTTGLDPFTRQIYAVRRWDAATQKETITIQVGIDGLRLIAARTNQLDGHDGPYWAGQDGKWNDAWIHSEPPLASKIAIYRKGMRYPFIGVARYDSYAQRKKDGRLSQFWEKMPDVMLAKVAEALALRKAFPSEMSSLYIAEEMNETTSLMAHENNSRKRDELIALINEKNLDINRLLRWANANSLDEIDDQKIDQAILMIRAKKTKADNAERDNQENPEKNT